MCSSANEKYANMSLEPRISDLRDQAVVQEPRQFGAFLNHYRKSPQAPECVVVSAVRYEPVSARGVHAIRRISRFFACYL